MAANEQEACGAFPLPPTGRRRRDRDRYRAQLAAFAETTYGSVDERLLRALDQAIERGGCRSTSEVTEFLRRWWPQLEVAA